MGNIRVRVRMTAVRRLEYVVAIKVGTYYVNDPVVTLTIKS